MAFLVRSQLRFDIVLSCLNWLYPLKSNVNSCLALLDIEAGGASSSGIDSGTAGPYRLTSRAQQIFRGSREDNIMRLFYQLNHYSVD